jgi:hypothetical protein
VLSLAKRTSSVVREMRRLRRARRQAELTEFASEVEEARPFLELAREIQGEVARIAADPSAHSDLLVELLERIPREERMKLARTVFDQLHPEQQWAIIEQVYGDGEITAYLEAERSARLADARLGAQRLDTARKARAEHHLDTRDVTRGEVLTLGLFREHDVRAAVSRGHTSSTCARRLVLRCMGESTFQVMQDVFNPNGGYFVTAEYSEETWRTNDRLPGHTMVRVGSITESAAGQSFEPVVYPGGRADFEVGGRPIPGRLHLGFAMLSDVDIFVR